VDLPALLAPRNSCGEGACDRDDGKTAASHLVVVRTRCSSNLEDGKRLLLGGERLAGRDALHEHRRDDGGGGGDRDRRYGDGDEKCR